MVAIYILDILLLFFKKYSRETKRPVNILFMDFGERFEALSGERSSTNYILYDFN
jgi:hypothetical protein